jgi:hypothetical protein
MCGSRELKIGLLTVSVAAAACRIADCGEGVAFSVLTSGGGYLAAMSVCGLSRRPSKTRAAPSRTDRGRISM